MKQIKSIKDLIDYLKVIPPRKWCTFVRDNGKGQRCVMGHIAAGLKEDPAWGSGADNLVRELNMTVHGIVSHNNGTQGELKTPKGRVMNYLRSQLS